VGGLVGAISGTLTPGCTILAYFIMHRVVNMKALEGGEKMPKVSPYYTSAETEYFVDRFPFRERSTWNQYGFLTSEEGL